MPQDTLDLELTKALQQARKKALNFALIGKGPSCVKLILSKKSIKPGEIQAAKKETGGKVVLQGICGGQGGELIFHITEEPPFTDTKLKAFLHEQTGISFKPQFQVVTSLPEVEDSEDEGEESSEDVSAASTRVADSEGKVGQETDQAGVSAVLADLNRLAPEIKSAVAAHPESRAEILQHVSSIQQDLKLGDITTGQATLVALQQLIGKLGANRSTSGSAVVQSADPPAEVRTGTVDYAKCRLAWDATKKSVHSELQKLERAILAEFNDAPGFDQLAAGVRKLDSVLLAFEEDLGDVLDDALNAPSESERQKLHQQAAALVEKFSSRALQDPFLQLLDDNPFVPIKARQSLTTALGMLSSRLK